MGKLGNWISGRFRECWLGVGVNGGRELPEGEAGGMRGGGLEGGGGDVISVVGREELQCRRGVIRGGRGGGG